MRTALCLGTLSCDNYFLRSEDASEEKTFIFLLKKKPTQSIFLSYEETIKFPETGSGNSIFQLLIIHLNNDNYTDSFTEFKSYWHQISLLFAVFKDERLLPCSGSYCKQRYVDLKGTSIWGRSLCGHSTSKCPRVTVSGDSKKNFTFQLLNLNYLQSEYTVSHM